MFERLVSVLRDQLNTDVNTLEAVDSGLVLPDVEDYYLCADEADADDVRANTQVGVYIWPASGAWNIDWRTTEMPGDVYEAVATTLVVVEIRAAKHPQTARTELGRTISGEMLEVWRGHRYEGALITCLKQHAVNFDDILDAYLESSRVRLTEQLVIARTEWAIEQNITIPTPDYTTV